jgi:NADH dehydrogenase
MKVLVTGGTGVIGEGAIPALLKAGHEVRLLTRGAEKDAAEWPEGVEPFAADVSRKRSLRGAADGCDAVVHITGIVNESPPKVTFESINVEGTQNILAEARRAGAGRFIFVSSLGADRGRSAYHQSKLKAEEHVKEFTGDWLILRPGGVYGPGDEVITTLLKLIRVLPVMPVVDGGEQRFQPLWFEDMGAAVAACVESELSREILELAGREVITVNDLIEKLSDITGRTPTRLPVPSFIATLGARLFDGNSLADGLKKLTGLDVPVDEAKLTMLLEENFIKEPARNALTETLGIEPLPLQKGLKALADLLPEQSVEEGVGSLERKRFHADIVGSRFDAEGLLEEFRARCVEVMPLEFVAEPGAASTVEMGATLTASIPMRGNIQVRVEEVTPKRLTFVTLEGHPLAGIVQFKTSALRSNSVRFMIEIHTRDASFFDKLTLTLGGSMMQNMNWQQVVERVVELSGGTAPRGVQSESDTLDEEETASAVRMIQTIMKRYKRVMNAARAEGIEKPPSPRAASKLKTRRTTSRRKSSQKQSAAKDARASVGDAVGKMTEAASSLLQTVSSAASQLTQASKKGRAKKAGR